MKQPILLLIQILLFGSGSLSAQSNNEFKINPFQWSYTASSPALVFEHTPLVQVSRLVLISARLQTCL